MRWSWSWVVMAACAGGPAVVTSDPADPSAQIGTDPPDVDTDPPEDPLDTVVVDSDPVVDSDTDLPVPAACHLGRGQAEFIPLADGAQVPVNRGVQGGWHVFGAVHCEGIDPGRSLDEVYFGEAGVEPLVRWQLLDTDGHYLGGYPDPSAPLDFYRPMRTTGGPAITGEILRIFTASYQQAIDRDVTMDFELTDKDGVHVTASVSIHLVDEAGFDTASP